MQFDVNSSSDCAQPRDQSRPHDRHDDSPGPCMSCPNAQACAGGLACRQFAVFQQGGREVRWRSASREPSAEIYQRLFGAVVQGNQLEIAFVDLVLEAWAFWSKRTGIDLRAPSAAKVLGITFVVEGQYHLPLTEDELLLVDRRIARLAERLRETLEVEYFWGAVPATMKARGLGLKRTAYRQRLHGAQWSIFMALHPHVLTWMARLEGRGSARRGVRMVRLRRSAERADIPPFTSAL